jgi:hypothetical protein
MNLIPAILFAIAAIGFIIAFAIGPKRHKDSHSGSVGAQIFGFLWMAAIFVGIWALHH